MITFDGAGYAVDEHVILSPTSLTLTEQRIGIIGANGSGKSTLARMINGLVEPTTGRVLVDDLDVAKQGAKVRHRVGFCFTNPSAQLVMPTCVEDIELSLRRLPKSERRPRALATLDRFGLAGRADQSVHTLSGGQKQILALAGVVAADPQIVIADEPTTLLDLRNTRRIQEFLFALDQMLILVTHDLQMAMACDRVLVVDSGTVVFDGPATDAVQRYEDLAGEYWIE